MAFVLALAALSLWMAGVGSLENRDNNLGTGLTFGAILVAYLAGFFH